MIYVFGEYELDTERYELRRAGAPCPIEPQVFDILRYLVEHRDRVVTKDELLDRVWGDRFVSEATLTSRLTAARRAIGDSGQEQRLIRTVHGRGYRFVGPVEEIGRPSAPTAPRDHRELVSDPANGNRPLGGQTTSQTQRSAAGITRAPSPEGSTDESVHLVGRETELAQLRKWLTEARSGRRQLVFVAGEAGLGKTTLVDAFLHDLRGDPSVRIAHGQCVEHHGTGEAYLPVLEALGRLCRAPDGHEVIALLADHAPTWLVQMPAFVRAADLDALHRRVAGSSRDRMLREMVESLETLTADRPLVLVFEDLHWSDPSTLDLIARVARRTEPAHLLLLGTYRPSDVRVHQHPLQTIAADLRLRGHAHELTPDLLPEPAIAAYLADRFPANRFPDALARLLHRRTDGNPLFVQTLLDAWVHQGLLVVREGRWYLDADLDHLAVGVPASLRLLVEQQMERLPVDTQVLLEAASVAGAEFSTATLAAATEVPEDEVEARCAELARQGRFLRPGEGELVEWPDGTVVASFAFIHSVYQDVVYDRIPPGRRARLHQRIGHRLEQAYATAQTKPAAELALHFTRGRDPRRAVQYLQLAAEQALQRSAHHEATAHLTAAFDLLPRLPEPPDRLALELRLQITLATALAATRVTAPEVEQAHVRALELCELLADTSALPVVVCGLAYMYEARGEYRTTESLIAQYMRQSNIRLIPEFSDLLACSAFHQGAFDQAIVHAGNGLMLPDHAPASQPPTQYDRHLGAHYHDWTALALWYQGYPEQALRRVQQAMRLAREHPFSFCHTRWTLATLHQHRGEPERTRECAEEAVVLAERQGFEIWAIEANALRGWALAVLGDAETGLNQLRQALADYAAAGVTMDRPYYLALLAEVLAGQGAVADALAALDEALALVHASRSYFYEAEIHRLRATLLLDQRPDDPSAAEASWREALAIARRQGARSIELRVAVDLGQLWQRQGKTAEARELVEAVYRQFAEGFDTADLRRANALLAELGTIS